MNKRELALLVLLFGVGAYSVYSMLYLENADQYQHSTNVTYSDFEHSVPHNHANSSPYNEANLVPIENNPVQHNRTTKPAKLSQNTTGLPYEFVVVGSKKQTSADEPESAYALFEHDQALHEIHEGDLLFGTSVRVTKILSNVVFVEYEEKRYKLNVKQPNLLSISFKEAEPDYSEFTTMTAEQIGSRPRIVEHVLSLTPTPYIADGMLIAPGMNPDLFKQAGFEDDDVLKTINGKRVTVDNEYEEIKRLMVQATTLEFKVMRKGRMITLYLDIPSETLKLRP